MYTANRVRLNRLNFLTVQGVYAQRLLRQFIFFFKYTRFCIHSVRKNVNYIEGFILTCKLSTSTYTPMESMA